MNSKINFDMEEKFERGSLRLAMYDFIKGGGDKDVVIEKLLDTVDSIRFTLKELVAQNLGQPLVGNPKEEHSQKKYPEGIWQFSSSMKYDEWRRFFVSHPFLKTYDDWCREHFDVFRSIKSVKNSSGEILTIGDETNYGKIICFKVSDDQILVGADKLPGADERGQYGIAQNMNGVHPKKKVYKTEDGYELKHGEKHFMVCHPEYVVHEVIEDVGERESRGTPQWMHVFKERKAADKYIDDNKPRFSKRQIEEAIVNSTIHHIIMLNPQLDNGKINPDVFKSNLGL